MQWRTLLGARGRALMGVGTACALTVQVVVSAAQQPGVVFRAFTEEALIHATVVDRSGHLVTNLAREDFDVRVGGRSIPLTTFSSEPQAITAVLLVGTSIVLADRFFQIRDAAYRFVDALGPEDRLRIGSFGTEVGLSPWLTSDKGVLKAVLAEELWPLGGASPLVQAVDQSVRSLSEERRPATVLVFGAGANTSYRPLPTIEQLRRNLFAERTMVYGVRLQGLWGNGSDLSYLARESGGGNIELKVDADLASTFRRIADELRRQYLLGFSVDARDDRIHRLEVRVPGRPDLTVRAPRGYVARPR